MLFSFIIPVFNRPEEVQELLHSLTLQTYTKPFEVVLVEDGSLNDCKAVVDLYKERLDIGYYYKSNSGPGDSRNSGMRKAKGSYFIILDSDCLLPADYLENVAAYLNEHYVDFFGGPDAALSSFSSVQKAINFSMTSFLTTGGIRGGSERLSKFQPRSFNMGISKLAFESSQGFGLIHPGEDPDLTIRLWEMGYESHLFPKAYVYHKRRIDWSKFYKQVFKFGKARPILNKRYPKYSKLSYWFPILFCFGFIFSVIASFFDMYLCIGAYLIYILLVGLSALFKEKSFSVAILSIVATGVQFYGYGVGFSIAYLKLRFSKSDEADVLPEMFFKSLNSHE